MNILTIISHTLNTILSPIRALLFFIYYSALLPIAFLITIAIIAYILGLGIQAIVPFLIFAIIIALIVSVTKIRHRRATIILGYLDQAIQLNLPIDWMLESAAASEIKTTRKRLNALRWELADGHSVASALQLTVPEINSRRIKLIETAEHIGQLAPILNQLHLSNDPNNPNRQSFKLMALAYPLVVLLSLTFCMITISIFVIPQFEEIYQDYDAPFPPNLLILSHFMSEYKMTIAFLGVLSVHTLLILATWALFQPKWLTLKPIRPFLDTLIFHTPILGKLAIHRGLAQVLPILATATASGVPLTSAINETLSLRINLKLIKQLDHTQRLLASGASIQNATQQAHLPILLTQMLAPAAQASAIPQTLDFLARYYQQRYSRTLAFIESAAAPAAILTLGLIVGWFITALFSPVFHLIDLTAQTTGLM